MNNPFKLVTAVNPKVINKSGIEQFNSKFINIKGTPHAFYEKVTTEGMAFCVSKLLGSSKYKSRKEPNFESAQIIGIDIDNKEKSNYQTYQSVLANEFIQEYASFLYITNSHSEALHRFRVIFVLDEPFTDPALYKDVVAMFIDKFKSDNQCKSSTQTFFGNSNCTTSDFLGKVLPKTKTLEMLEEYNLNKPKKPSKPKNSNKPQTALSYDNHTFTTIQIDEMLGYVFKNGNIQNEEWMKIISALKNHSGLSDDEIKNLVSQYVELGDIDAKLAYAHNYPKLNMGTVIYFAQKNGYTLPKKPNGSGSNYSDKFVEYTMTMNKDGDTKYNIKPNFMGIRDYLNSCGFKMIYDTDNIVRMGTDNIIKKTIKQDIVKIIENDIIKGQKYPTEVIISLFEKISMPTSTVKSFIENLDYVKLTDLNESVLKDEMYKTNLYFKNGILEVTHDDYNLINYSDSKKPVWESKILSKVYDKADSKTSEFQQFLELVSTDYDESTGVTDFKKENYDCLKGIVGYLCSSYKDPKYSKIIFLTDGNTSAQAEGGTGKSLFMKFIKQLKIVTEIDGKSLDMSSRFKYDSINNETQILALNDINKSYDVKTLYNLVTDAFTFEKKGKDSITLEFDESPKIMITSNYALKSNGNSDDRRIIVAEFSNYLVKKESLYNKFGHNLIADWDDKEFNRFYKFVIECIQYYFSEEKIPESYNSNYKYKQLIVEIGEDIFRAYQNTVYPNTFLSASKLLDEVFQELGEEITSTKLTQTLKVYSKAVYSKEPKLKYTKEIGCKWYYIPTSTTFKNESQYEKLPEFTQFVEENKKTFL